MKSLVAGVLVIGLSLLILIGFLAYGGHPAEGDYRMGQFPGLAFGSLLLAVGVFYAVRGLKEMGQPSRGKRSKKKQPRRK
jgi:hypothetical protein